MYAVKLTYISDSYLTNVCYYYINRDNADRKERELLIEMYNSIFDKDIQYDNELENYEIFNEIDELREYDDFDICVYEIKTED